MGTREIIAAAGAAMALQGCATTPDHDQGSHGPDSHSVFVTEQDAERTARERVVDGMRRDLLLRAKETALGFEQRDANGYTRSGNLEEDLTKAIMVCASGARGKQVLSESAPEFRAEWDKSTGGAPRTWRKGAPVLGTAIWGEHEDQMVFCLGVIPEVVLVGNPDAPKLPKEDRERIATADLLTKLAPDDLGGRGEQTGDTVMMSCHDSETLMKVATDRGEQHFTPYPIESSLAKVEAIWRLSFRIDQNPTLYAVTGAKDLRTGHETVCVGVR